MEYEFEFEIEIDDEFTDDLANRIYDVCDDAFVGRQFGRTTVEFMRVGNSYEEVVYDACKSLGKIGILIKKVIKI